MSGLRDRYEALVASGELRPDPEQRAAVTVLARVQDGLEDRSEMGFLASACSAAARAGCAAPICGAASAAASRC